MARAKCDGTRHSSLFDGCNLVSPVRGAEYEQILQETGDLICTGWANMHMGWGCSENICSQLKSPLNNIVYFTSVESDFHCRKIVMDGTQTSIWFYVSSITHLWILRNRLTHFWPFFCLLLPRKTVLQREDHKKNHKIGFAWKYTQKPGFIQTIKPENIFAMCCTTD